MSKLCSPARPQQKIVVDADDCGILATIRISLDVNAPREVAKIFSRGALALLKGPPYDHKDNANNNVLSMGLRRLIESFSSTQCRTSSALFAPLANRAAPLMTTKGQVTQAVYIFTNMLRKLLQDEQPKYIAAIFESKEKTFRHETFTEYKANREQMPEDLASQLPYIKRLCEAYNIPMISVTGYEADDVIGTLAVQAANKGLQAVIVSNDKDMCQMVRDPLVVCMRQNSQVVKRKEPVPPIEWCNEAWVEKKFGVPANKLVDLLGLMGDLDR